MVLGREGRREVPGWPGPMQWLCDCNSHCGRGSELGVDLPHGSGVPWKCGGGSPGTSVQLGNPQIQAAPTDSSSYLAAAREQARLSPGERWAR
jgi:hypothetical protein